MREDGFYFRKLTCFRARRLESRFVAGAKAQVAQRRAIARLVFARRIVRLFRVHFGAGGEQHGASERHEKQRASHRHLAWIESRLTVLVAHAFECFIDNDAHNSKESFGWPIASWRRLHSRSVDADADAQMHALALVRVLWAIHANPLFKTQTPVLTSRQLALAN